MHNDKIAEAAAGVSDRDERGTVEKCFALEGTEVLPSCGTGLRDEFDDFVQDLDGECEERVVVIMSFAENESRFRE